MLKDEGGLLELYKLCISVLVLYLHFSVLYTNVVLRFLMFKILLVKELPQTTIIHHLTFYLNNNE